MKETQVFLSTERGKVRGEGFNPPSSYLRLSLSLSLSIRAATNNGANERTCSTVLNFAGHFLVAGSYTEVRVSSRVTCHYQGYCLYSDTHPFWKRVLSRLYVIYSFVARVADHHRWWSLSRIDRGIKFRNWKNGERLNESLFFLLLKNLPNCILEILGKYLILDFFFLIFELEDSYFFRLLPQSV